MLHYKVKHILFESDHQLGRLLQKGKYIRINIIYCIAIAIVDNTKLVALCKYINVPLHQLNTFDLTTL